MKRLIYLLIFLLIPIGAGPVLAQKIARETIEGQAIQSHAGIGVMPFYPIYFDQPYIGFEGYATLRPSYAKYFYPEFEQHNIGIGLNLSYLMTEENRGFYKVDVVFRKYFSQLDQRLGEDSAFFGLGIGVTGFRWDASYVTQRDVSWIVEMGYEYRVLSEMLATVKVQLNRIKVEQINFTGVSIVLALGWRFES